MTKWFKRMSANRGPAAMAIPSWKMLRSGNQSPVVAEIEGNHSYLELFSSLVRRIIRK